MEIVTLGIDLAKSIFALHGVDVPGKVVLQRPSVKRAKLMDEALRISGEKQRPPRNFILDLREEALVV